MIKSGIIGMSEGHGHPYSWSAINNGNHLKESLTFCVYLFSHG